jgi:ketosteroid isomerase-like protein
LYLPELNNKKQEQKTMKKLLAATLITIVSTFAAFAQKSKAEQEILKIQASLDQAVLKKDIAVFERVLADDYVYSNAYGEMMNRAESFEDMRREWANTKFRKLTASTDDIKVKVSGNMALVTANWTATTIPRDVPNAEPHKDTGRYTGVYEKRGGNWASGCRTFFRSSARPEIDGTTSLKSRTRIRQNG